MRATPLAVRFWEKVNKRGPVHPKLRTRCWEWTGCLTRLGYGLIGFEGKTKSAHRAAWFLYTGAWPVRDTLHKCDNTACVRYAHLFQGNHTENMRDMMHKGRGNKPKGSETGNSTLTERDVSKIKRALQRGCTSISLARLYAVSADIICFIKTGRTWKHVE
jgi:hypothetical protein